jgi:AcrR family transcriptional regulator
MPTTSLAKQNEPPRRRAPRLAGDTRRAQIVDAACRFFADHGFSGPTRDLAASIGVTQALLYRYFDSKTELIEAVFAEVFRDHWSVGALDGFTASEGAPMIDRLVGVYEAMMPRLTAVSTRLFFRAGLDSVAEPICRAAGKCWPLWAALLDQWRREEGLPALAVKPMLEGERSLMLSLHNAMVMIRVREYVFHAPSMLEDSDEIRQVAEVYDAGARIVLRRLHSGEAGQRRGAPMIEALEAA